MNTREKMMKARAEIAVIRGIPEAEVSGWEAGFLAWGYEDEVDTAQIDSGDVEMGVRPCDACEEGRT